MLNDVKKGSRVGIRVAAQRGVRAGELLEAPPLVVRHAVGRERLGETLLEDLGDMGFATSGA